MRVGMRRSGVIEVPNGDDRGPSAAGDEGHHDVGGVSVEALASAVVDGGGSWVGVTGCDLYVSQRHAGVEGGHDERGSQHVGVDRTEPGSFRDGAHPPVGGAPFEPLTIAAPEDGAFVAFADGEVDGPRGARYERDDGVRGVPRTPRPR
jgi:hypothetical protein